MRYNESECCFELSLSELCALGARDGDIGSRPPSDMNVTERSFDAFLSLMPDFDRALESSRALPEFINTAALHGIYYTVNASPHRAYRRGDIGFVDRFEERKYYEESPTPDGYGVAMLKSEAYFYACRHSLSRVNVRMVFCFRGSKKIKIIEDSFTVDALRAAYFALLEEISFRASLMLERMNEILPRARRAPFPYTEVRGGQEEMISAVYRGIVKGRDCVIQAPTGIGKTVSALYPSMRALAEGRADKIFYLTAKTSTSREAFAAMSRMFSAGARLKTVTLGSKESMCIRSSDSGTCGGSGGFCNGLDCPFARNYYERARMSLRELVSSYNGYTQSLIISTARRHGICPYELSLDLSELCDVIICDYNYVFDPIVYLRRYFEGGARGRYVFLIDEAHNLPDRAVEMYSAELSRSSFASIASLLPPEDRELTDELDGFLRVFDECRALCRDNSYKDERGEEYGYYISRNPYSAIDSHAETLARAIYSWLRRNRLSPLYGRVRSLGAELSKYRKIGEIYDEHYVFFTTVLGAEVKIRLSCLDPSYSLSLCRERAVSSAMFSATLEPLDYFSDMLGAGRGATRLTLPSPFDSEKLCLVSVDSVSTRYGEREGSYKKLVSLIAAALTGRAGNYIVFFPSYKYMMETAREFARRYPRLTLIVQSSDMSRAERERFIGEFKEDTGVLRVGFCVLGGSFSEGIDLPGTRLIGTVIVGVGLPGLSNERNVMREYFENTRENGYDYAYTYPGMNRVLQAAGRVIRTEDDRGVVVLIDDRYATEQYRAIMPREWSGMEYVHSASELSERVKKFWSET